MKWLPLYFIYITTFGTAAFEKFQGGVPDWFVKQFGQTFFAEGPGGVGSAFYSIACLETVTCVLFLISLLKLEFTHQKKRVFLELALFFGVVSFAALGFGLRITHDFTGSFQLFCYGVLTFGLLLYVERPLPKA